MTPATPSTGSPTPLNQQGGPLVFSGPATPMGNALVGPGDFPDIEERRLPTVFITYRPGACGVQSAQILDGDAIRVVQTLCRDLGVEPDRMAFASGRGPEPWTHAFVLLDQVGEDGAKTPRRVAQVAGLSQAWLDIGARQIVQARRQAALWEEWRNTPDDPPSRKGQARGKGSGKAKTPSQSPALPA